MQSIDVLANNVLDASGVDQRLQRHVRLCGRRIVEGHIYRGFLAFFLQRPDTIRAAMTRAELI